VSSETFWKHRKWGGIILAREKINSVGIYEIKLCSKMVEICVKTFVQNLFPTSPPLPRTAIGLRRSAALYYTTLIQKECL
jgi:hypothetical protein